MTQDSIEYRLEQQEQHLDTIDEKLDKMTELITKTALQGEEIKNMTKQQASMLNSLQDHEKRIRVLEIVPERNKAANWDKVVDIIVKTIMAAVLAVVLAKIGLS